MRPSLSVPLDTDLSFRLRVIPSLIMPIMHITTGIREVVSAPAFMYTGSPLSALVVAMTLNIIYKHGFGVSPPSKRDRPE